MISRSTWLALIMLCLALVSGCTQFQALGPGLENSHDIKGGQVELRLLTLEDIATYSHMVGWRRGQRPEWKSDISDITNLRSVLEALCKAPQDAESRASAFEDRVKEVFIAKEAPESAAALLAATIPFVVDWVFTQAKNEFKEAANAYEGQFEGVSYAGAFWRGEGEEKNTVVPHYAGFELVRWSQKYPKPAEGVGEPAFRLVAAFVPSPEDNRFFLVEPLFLQIRSSRAKVAESAGTLQVRLRSTLEASWVDKELKLQKQNVATIDWLIGGYPLASAKAMYFSRKTQPGKLPFVAGWFLGPPLSYKQADETNKPPVLIHTGTPIRLAVVVDERDETQAKQLLEKASGVLDTVQPKVQDLLQEAVTSQGASQ